jgi:hypothetical protein
MIGVVQEIARTSKGAPYVVIDAQRYYASQCKTPPTGLTTGMRIEFTAEPFGDTGSNGKRPMGLLTWKAIVDAQGKPETASTVTDVDVLRSVSNVVGSACAAGTVKTPEELEKWFVAAWFGFTRTLPAAKEAMREPGQDDEPDPDDSAQLASYAEAKQRGNAPPW